MLLPLLLGCVAEPTVTDRTSDSDVYVTTDTSRPTDPTTDTGPPPDGHVVLRADGLYVDGEPFPIRGVAWNPVPVGGVQPADLDFAGFVAQDAPLMAAAGIRVVRTFEPITEPAVLDTLYAHGIYVMSTVLVAGDDTSAVAGRMRPVVDHPAILMWLIGNEWNYNGFYVGLGFDASVELVREAAAIVKREDPTRPVGTVYGEVPSRQLVADLDGIDVWGLNVYRGISFGGLFDDWGSRAKPMFLAEFGADAWNADAGREDEAAQAEATAALIGEIEAELTFDGGPALGGVVFEWSDEWWKDESGSPSEHDVGGIAPGGGPHPDATFNEEWWGLVEIDRTPREAYDAVQGAWNPAR